MDEKRAGPARGIEHRESRHAVQRERRAFVEQHVEPRVGDACNEREGREERAGPPPLARCHQRLERFAEHLGIDRRFSPGGALFASGEPILREQIVEQRAERVVGKRDTARHALDRCTGEEAAVEKRHVPKRARRGGAPADRRVERAEEQRPQDSVVEPTAAGHTALVVMEQKRPIPVEPAFRLEKREEQES